MIIAIDDARDGSVEVPYMLFQGGAEECLLYALKVVGFQGLRIPIGTASQVIDFLICCQREGYDDGLGGYDYRFQVYPDGKFSDLGASLYPDSDYPLL